MQSISAISMILSSESFLRKFNGLWKLMSDVDLVLPTLADGEDKSSSLGNRIRKNYRHLRKWAKRTETDAFRIYGSEMREYPFFIDFYAGKFYVQYLSKRSEDDPPQSLFEEVYEVISRIFGVGERQIYWRVRSKKKETRQYEKVGHRKEFFVVREYGALFKVNLSDYLDTGLFLDHRETRQLVAKACRGKSLLNLFSYTCAFSVQAALGGALFTKSVDMSNTYTEWGRENFLLNRISLKNHPVVRADCLKFLDDELKSRERYDLIVIDPPTISRSKKMDQLFDIQNDYFFLISKALRLLKAEGMILFSTNSRKFTFDEELFKGCAVIEISEKTIPIDFWDTKVHRCWKIDELRVQ